MSSLSEKIASLSNPAPVVLDPEDDVNIETAAKVQNHSGSKKALFTSSELRSRAAVLLDDSDPAYIGKKVSRKSLGGMFSDDSKEPQVSEETDNSDSHDEEDEEMEDENNLQKFKEMLDKQINSDEGNEESEDDRESGEEDESDESEGSEDVETVCESYGDSAIEYVQVKRENNLCTVKAIVTLEHKIPKEGYRVTAICNEEDEVVLSALCDSCAASLGDDMTNKFSNIGVTSEKEKGYSIKAQQEIWNRLCELRIKHQKSLIIFNKLPQGETFNKCKKKAGEKFANASACDSLKRLLNRCINLQEKLLQHAPEFNSENKSNKGNGKSSNDEEIVSDTDEEMEVDHKEETQKRKVKAIKRKLKCDEYHDELTKRRKTLFPYRHAVIQKWDEKTKLSSGKITQKSFAAFESSTLKQIEQVIQDEDRLIKRTQLKRSLYRVLGKPEVSENKTLENLSKNESESKQDMFLKDYDAEIFDDDDFYRQLLKEVIESKSAGINPAVLRKQMEIQCVRNKIKRKVDTKASKGRKIRYDIHQKLVGYMRKIETTTMSDDARENLLKSIFGKYISSL